MLAGANDLTSRRFGRLVAIKATGEVDARKGRLWECRCDCGNACVVPAAMLLENETHSCGCLKEEQNRKNLRSDYTTLHPGENAIKRITRTEPQRNNTSGAKGVSWHKRAGKWSARIQYQGRSISLGYHDTVEEAAEARRKAEEKLSANKKSPADRLRLAGDRHVYSVFVSSGRVALLST